MKSFSIKECERDDDDFIVGKLIEFNLSQVPPIQEFRFRDVGRKMVDEDGRIVAGVLGRLNAWSCLHIDFLWVDEDYRREGLGSGILAEIETVSKGYGCCLVYLDTFDFQAKDFYLKHGYEIFGVLNGCPPDHDRYFLKKTL